MLRGTPAVQLKGGTTSNIRSGASEPTERQMYSYRDADRNLERQSDPETQRDSEAPHTPAFAHSACPCPWAPPR